MLHMQCDKLKLRETPESFRYHFMCEIHMNTRGNDLGHGNNALKIGQSAAKSAHFNNDRSAERFRDLTGLGVSVCQNTMTP